MKHYTVIPIPFKVCFVVLKLMDTIKLHSIKKNSHTESVFQKPVIIINLLLLLW